jgi:outer membrane protein TolC
LSYLRFLSDDYSITDVKDFKVIKPPTTSIAELQRIALKNRNDLKWMQKNLETMQKRVKFIRADKYPMVGAHLEYGFSDNSLTLDRDKDYYMLAAGLKWNIFDSSLGAKSEQAKIDAMQIAHYYEYMKKGIKLDVEQKLLNYKAKRAVVQEKITNKELAEEILKKYTYMYKQGMINITILLMKEAGARKARAELIKAKFEEALAAAELKKALGDFIKESK